MPEWISPKPNALKMPMWPFTISYQPTRKVPTDCFLVSGDKLCWRCNKRILWSASFGSGWKLSISRASITLKQSIDYNPEDDYMNGFAIDLDGSPIIVESVNSHGMTTLPPASKFMRRLGKHLVPFLYYKEYKLVFFPTNPSSWHGRAIQDEDYYIDASGNKTTQYIGPYYAHKWWGFSGSGYDHSHCHFNFGRFFRITWLESGNYQHWMGNPEQEEWYWNAIKELRESQPIRTSILNRWAKFKYWLFK